MNNDDKVTRYDLDKTFGECSMMSHINGDYVHWDDYANLESLCDEYERLCQSKDKAAAEQAFTIAALKEQQAIALSGWQAANRALASQPAAPTQLASNEVLKEIRRDLAHVENYLEKSGAPSEVRNRTIDIRASLHEIGQPAAPVQPELSDLKKLQIVAGCAVDDLEQIHAALGFPDDQPIDAEDMIEAIEELQAATGTVPAAPPVQQPDDVRDLHAEIMNLPCKLPMHEIYDPKDAYRMGHRDARHAAAELTSSALATTRPGVKPHASVTDDHRFLVLFGDVLENAEFNDERYMEPRNAFVGYIDSLIGARAILAASGGAEQVVSEGCVVVPKEPTRAMLDAGDSDIENDFWSKSVWEAMIAAAPTIQGEGSGK